MSVWTSAISPATRSVSAPMPAAMSSIVARLLEDRVRARDEVDAGGDHRRRVDEGADRRRAFHRVGQPGLERDLRRLRDGAAEQAERDPVRRASPRGWTFRAPNESELVCAMSDEQRERHRRVAERVHHERLLRRRDRARPLVPEADQQVRREADEPPADEQQEQVAALDEHAASRRRRARCTRSSGAPRGRRPCSRSSRGR